MKSMGEFDLIHRYFRGQSPADDFIALGIGDDAALINVRKPSQLAVSTDMLVVDRHFKMSWPASAIAHRALAANLSDMAAMGALPKAILLSLALPEVDEQWLSDFSSYLKQQLEVYQMHLIGGDTVKAPLAITLTIIGEILGDKALTRCGAKLGDAIYVSGSLGDCAYALSRLDSSNTEDAIVQKLFYPKAQVELGQLLTPYATSAIDVSDGLLQDLGHLLKSDALGAEIYLDRLPLGPNLKSAKLDNPYEIALASGEEYELCFTVSHEQQVQLENLLATHRIACQRIGVIDKKPGIRLLDESGSQVTLDVRGYQHF